MSPFEEDPNDGRTELDLCIEEIKQLQSKKTKLLSALEKIKINAYPGLAVKESTLLNQIYRTANQAIIELKCKMKAREKMIEEKLRSCPFCDEDDFDLIGLKHHLRSGHCEVFGNTLTPEEATDIWNEKSKRKEKT